MSKQGEIFVGGKWEKGSGQLLESHNPANGEIIWRGNAASNKDVEVAIIAAKNAFEQWSLLPVAERIKYIEAFRKILETEKNNFAETISKETGKPLWDSKGEVSAMIAKVAISIEAYNQRTGEVHKSLPNAELITRHKPHGTVAVLGPFNFPAHLPNGHIIPALIAGNTVIFKPSELTPAVAELMMSYWDKSGIPAGVVNMLQGGGDIGKALSTHSQIDGLFFTGSWKTGKILSEQFGRHPEKILALEMGGNNPLIIGNVSDIQAAAYITIQSAFLTSGQRCTCARRLIVPNTEVGNKFLNELVKMMSLIRVGSFTESPEPFMGPVIHENAANQLLEAQNLLKSNGAISIVEMKKLKPNLPFLSPGLIDVTEVKDREDEELFGPILQLIRVRDIQNAIKEANNSSYGLSAGLLSDDQGEYDFYIKNIKAGCANWNAPLTGASSAAPFGGVGRSGNHRPSAFYAADYCAYPVASLENRKLKMPETKAPGIDL